MASQPRPARIALVVHPTRSVSGALQTLRRWAREHELDIVQIAVAGGPERPVSAQGQLEPGDLVVALGGDGTMLSALRASANVGAPVLGVACGSLGVLAAVPARRLSAALERVITGDWTARRIPALAIHPAEASDEWALNDFVVVRRGAGQVVVDVSVDQELYVRLAGDGLIVATALGSTGYSMAAGGPVVLPGMPAVLCTPLAMHGGSGPPLVVPASSNVHVKVHPSFAGFEIEIDGHGHPLDVLDYDLSLHEETATMVSFDNLGLGLDGIRRRGLIMDSPRVLARDSRTGFAPERR